MYFIAQTLHIPQTLLSAYGIYLSYISITNLRRYEEKSEQAAQWSEVAAEQLARTRATAATGALVIFFSFSTSLLLIAGPNEVPPILRYTLSPILLVACLAARAHVGGFWAKKHKVPFVEGFNEAIEGMQDIVRVLKLLEYSWVVSSFVGAVVGY